MKYLVVTSILFLNVYFSFANGGPIDESFVHKSAHVQLIEQEKINILEENLDITIEGNYCEVQVEYLLKNTAEEENWVEYGFPVDFYYPEAEFFADNESGEKGNIIALYWQDEYVKDFEILEDGVKKEYFNKIEFDTRKDTVRPSDEYGEMIVETARKWYISNLYFAKNGTIKLQIKYKIKNTYSDAAYTKSYYPFYSDRLFRYDFSPAGFWGKGKAGKFNMLIDASSIKKSGGTVQIKGLKKITEKKGIYSYKAKNFNFNKNREMTIIYNSDNAQKSEYVNEHYPGEEFLSKTKLRSSVKDLNKDYLFDKDFTQGDFRLKKGDWFELVFPQETIDFGVIGIINGNTDSKKDYYNNARIKSMNFEFVYYYFDNPDTSIESYEQDFEDKDFDEFNENYIYSFISEILQRGDSYLKPVRLKITVTEIYPGKKSNEVVIPEMIFLGKMANNGN